MLILSITVIISLSIILASVHFARKKNRNIYFWGGLNALTMYISAWAWFVVLAVLCWLPKIEIEGDDEEGVQNKKENFCTSCDKTIGVKIIRPTGQVWLFSVIALLSFAGILVYALLEGPSVAESYAQQAWGSEHGKTGISDSWILLPLSFVILAIQRFLSTKKVCPICNCDL